MPTINIKTVEPLTTSASGTQTNSFVPTTATAYQRGDLLVVSEDGVLTHADKSNIHFNVVCLEDCSAEQATAHASKKIGIPVYTHGEINLNAVKIQGTLLNDEQKPTARASSVKTSIALRLPANNQ